MRKTVFQLFAAKQVGNEKKYAKNEIKLNLNLLLFLLYCRLSSVSQTI